MKNIVFEHILSVERNSIVLIKRFSRNLKIRVFLAHKRKAIFMKNNFLFPVQLYYRYIIFYHLSRRLLVITGLKEMSGKLP